MGEFKEIKCPYCFKTFKHDEVHFRLAEQTVNKATIKMRAAQSEVEKSVYEKYSGLNEIDPKFYEIWGVDKGGDLIGQDKKLFYLPHINHNNIKTMVTGEDYIRDKDGFVESIEDNLEKFISKTRICPHCHNKLPSRYGRNEQKFISILGVSSSGKTVFVKQLLARIQDALSSGILSHIDGSFVDITLPADDQEYLELGKPLPESTTTLNFKIPYFVTLSFKKDGIVKTYDFVIYDVAGETLIYESGKENQFDFFAGYIKESDAIITLIDPMQLISDPPPKYPASKMISTLYSVFGDRVKVPTAITLSKSDLLMTNPLVQQKLNPNQKYFNANSQITKNISWNMQKKYFYMDEYEKLRGPLKKFFKAIATEFNQSVEDTFVKSNYFAIASLLQGVDQKLTLELTPNSEWTSNLIDDFIDTFPILESELVQLRDDLREQEEHPDEAIIDINNLFVEKSFIFDQNSNDCIRMDDILGRISQLLTKVDIRKAVYENFAKDYSIALFSEYGAEEKLNIDDFIEYIYILSKANEHYNFNMYIQGYPRTDGNLESLRIEEPVFWLLAELGIIKKGNLKEKVNQNQSQSRIFGVTKSIVDSLFGGNR